MGYTVATDSTSSYSKLHRNFQGMWVSRTTSRDTCIEPFKKRIMTAMTHEVKGYRILERIAGVRGSEIHKAITPDGERVVAARIYHPGLSQNRQLLLTLRDTLRSIATLSHPNILAIHGSGLLNGRPYIITEFPVWGNLQDRLHSGTLAALDIIQVFREAADALSSAHAHGIIHGDLQPCDIGFDEDGHVLISGFGEAQVFDALQTNGAPRAFHEEKYLAPEVINSGNRGYASDQYALAAIILEVVQGPAVGETSDVTLARYRNQAKHAQHTRKSAFSLSRNAIEVLHKAMAEDPDNRFSSIDAFEHAFLTAMGREHQSAMANEKSSSPPPPTSRRNPRRFLAYLATTLAIALLFIFTIPALSAAWKGDNTDRSPMDDTSQPISEGTTKGQPSLDRGNGDGVVQTNPDLIDPAEPTQDPSQAWIVIQQAYPSPTPTKLALPMEQPQTSPTAVPSDATDVPPTNTPSTDTPPTDIPPTNTPPPTTVPEPSPTPTTESSSFKCSSSPKHPHYCTPTPEG
jgi:serine/threonine protein kinase